jgi:hypothetical protein
MMGDGRRSETGRRSVPQSELYTVMSDSKEWHLQPETEYRFELDPAASLAIKVKAFSLPPPSLTIRSS